jgi:hypothetical protein
MDWEGTADFNCNSTVQHSTATTTLPLLELLVVDIYPPVF